MKVYSPKTTSYHFRILNMHHKGIVNNGSINGKVVMLYSCHSWAFVFIWRNTVCSFGKIIGPCVRLKFQTTSFLFPTYWRIHVRTPRHATCPYTALVRHLQWSVISRQGVSTRGSLSSRERLVFRVGVMSYSRSHWFFLSTSVLQNYRVLMHIKHCICALTPCARLTLNHCW